MNQEKLKELEKMVVSDYNNITGIVVQKNGAGIYERYFNGFTADDAVHIFSVTKSIFSALIGIAIEQGHIKGVDCKVLEFFPDYEVMPGEKTIQCVTVENLLTMTAPYKCEEEPYEAYFSSSDWVKAGLDLLGGERRPGQFLYSPIIGVHILAGILAKTTGRPVLDFASEYLFSPLGISVTKNIELADREEHFAFGRREKHDRSWVVDPQGINTASWGLTLTPVDMAKIGQLYLNGGRWEDRQLIPEKWIDVSTQKHVGWNDLSYGYLWWVIDEKERCYAALGDGGNVIYVNQKKNMVVSIASLFMPDAKDRIEFIRDSVEPIFENWNN